MKGSQSWREFLDDEYGLSACAFVYIPIVKRCSVEYSKLITNLAIEIQTTNIKGDEKKCYTRSMRLARYGILNIHPGACISYGLKKTLKNEGLQIFWEKHYIPPNAGDDPFAFDTIVVCAHKKKD